MRLLAIDTALDRCAAAIAVDGQIVSEHSEDMRVGHAERLFPIIETVLDAAGISYRELNLIAVVSGPGSFSGIRIGIAAARGLALSLKIPAIGLGTLVGLAEEARGRVPEAKQIWAINAAPLDRVFMQGFTVHHNQVAAETEARMMEPQAVEAEASNMGSGSVAIGSATASCEGKVSTCIRNRGFPDLAAVARLAEFEVAKTQLPVPPVPVYLRPPDAQPRLYRTN